MSRNHSSDWDFDAIKRELESEPWGNDPENDDSQVRRVWLGTIFGITPSGKYYQPFACSNVAGDCAACNGTGERKPAISRRHIKRAQSRLNNFARRTMALSVHGGWMEHGTPAQRYTTRIQAYRDRAA